jgi:hypothetical protein
MPIPLQPPFSHHRMIKNPSLYERRALISLSVTLMAEGPSQVSSPNKDLLFAKFTDSFVVFLSLSLSLSLSLFFCLSLCLAFVLLSFVLVISHTNKID